MRVLILANGSEPSYPLLKQFLDKCEYFIAADGGGDIALRYGLSPDTVIGDMDSFQQKTHFEGGILHDPDQETNDLEKALKHAMSKKAARVDVLGATGKRLDHSLKNLSVMQQFQNHFDSLSFIDDALYSRILPRDFSMELPPGHLVSLFPLSGIVDGVITEGLKFPLNNELLQNGLRDGTSNQTIHGAIRIRHRTGTLLFMSAMTECFL